MIQELGQIKYKRAIVPSDAESLNIDTIDFGDASKELVCVAIYARFKRTNGEYSCQLVLARSKLVPDDMTLPRAELFAALLNAHTGEVVRRAFSKVHQSSVKLTDSQIALHWISNDAKPLKQWARTRVIEIKRWTNKYHYITSKKNLADMGTRPGVTLPEVTQDSKWNLGDGDWMNGPREEFPIQSAEEVILNNLEIQELMKEYRYGYNPAAEASHICTGFLSNRNVPEEVGERYEFSQYIIDINRRDFGETLRILGIAHKFIWATQDQVKKRKEGLPLKKKETRPLNELPKPQIVLTEEEIGAAESYIFKKATAEVKHFMKKDQYEKISKEEDGILKFTGRILPTNEIVVVGNMTDAMKDLSATTFCVPLVEKHSPIAYRIVDHVHWKNEVVKHRGVQTMHRYVLKKAFIFQGKELVKKMKKLCERCRYLSKKTIEVSMGPVSNHNLTIAPAFYVSQVDIAGPFKSYSQANKRATIKIWMTVFVCATTSTTSIKVMEDYSTTAFIQAFVRLACEVGYPKIMLADSGSQLVKGCSSVELSYQDLKFRLHKETGVELELCPVGGHNMNGKVERKIQEIKKSFDINLQNERLSLIQWETVCAQVANAINDLPLALGGETGDLDSLDLLTPNRLRLGRNNERSPTGIMITTNDHNRILEHNKHIFETWFENWLLLHVPKMVNQPKWFTNQEDMKVGDIVLFRKDDKVLSSTYQYGMVAEVMPTDGDGLIRKVKIRYRNHNEDTDRYTFRAVRQLVVIHHVDETNLVQELGEIACAADAKLRSCSTDEE